MGRQAKNQNRAGNTAKPAGRVAPRRTSMADALFSRTRQRVLGLVFGQPARSFFATELIALVGSGSGAVQRELQRLAESDLVVVTRIGNQKHYQANRAAPLFEELCGIVRKTIGLVDPLRASLAKLGKRIHLALVFGSIAKRRDSARSDIDLLIVGNGITLEEIYSALEPVEQSLGRKVNPTLYTEAEFESRRTGGNPFLTKVLKGETVFLIGKEGHVPATAR